MQQVPAAAAQLHAGAVGAAAGAAAVGGAAPAPHAQAVPAAAWPLAGWPPYQPAACVWWQWHPACSCCSQQSGSSPAAVLRVSSIAAEGLQPPHLAPCGVLPPAAAAACVSLLALQPVCCYVRICTRQQGGGKPVKELEVRRVDMTVSASDIWRKQRGVNTLRGWPSMDCRLHP